MQTHHRSIIALLTLTMLLAAPLAVASPNPDGGSGGYCAERLDVGLVIDRSGSMSGTRIQAAKDGSKQFLDQLDGDDQSGLVSFAGSATLDKSIDFSHAATKTAVDALSAGGGTNMEPAISTSANDIDAKGRGDARHIMVVLTDGYSSPDPVNAADNAKLMGIEIYVIAVGDNVNEPELRSVASNPDSKYYHEAQTDAEVVAAYQSVFEEIECDPPGECYEKLDIGLVIDRSGSMSGTRIQAAKDGSSAFLDKLDPDDQSGLVSFASSETLDKSLDADHGATKSAVNALSAGGGTNMQPAIERSHQDIDLYRRADARQIMVVLTDGYSSPDPVVAADAAKVDNIEVYVIAVGDNVNEPELRAVASDPDSKYYHHAQTDAEVEMAYDNVFGEITCDQPPECTNAPLDVGLVIDRSGSMSGTRIQAAKDGSKRFLDRLGGDDQSGLVSFASSQSLDQSLTFTHAATKSAVDALSAGGGTNMEPAIDESTWDIQAFGRPHARHVMVVLTDGYSSPDPVAAADRARAAGIEVYVIAVGDNVNEPELRAVASDPDSKYYHHALNDADVELAYDSVFEEIDCPDPDPPCPPALDVDLAVDRSVSMDALRLGATLEGLSTFVGYLDEVDRSGITVTVQDGAWTWKEVDGDHEATVQRLREVPLASDLHISKEMSSEAAVAGVDVDVTSVSGAIQVSSLTMRDVHRYEAGKVLVLVLAADAADADQAVAAADAARAAGIDIYLVGLGLQQPSWSQIVAPDRLYVAPTVADIDPQLKKVALDLRCIHPPEPPVCVDAESIVADGGQSAVPMEVSVDGTDDVDRTPTICIDRIDTPVVQKPASSVTTE